MFHSTKTNSSLLVEILNRRCDMVGNENYPKDFKIMDNNTSTDHKTTFSSIQNINYRRSNDNIKYQSKMSWNPRSSIFDLLQGLKFLQLSQNNPQSTDS